MTIQITVRLPDDEVKFIDDQVKARKATGRAAVVSKALRREQRRQAAIRDLDILAAAANDSDPDDLHGLAAWAQPQALDLD